MRFLPMFLLLALMIASPVSHSFAATASVGTVKRLIGTAVAMRGSEQVPLNLGDPIFEGDLIKTGPRSSIYAAMYGGENNAIRLGQKSQLEVKSYTVSEGSVFGGFLRGLVGIFTVELNNLRSGGDFTMKTPTAVLGVRGTVWGGIVKTDGSTSFSVLRGAVTIKMGGRTISLGKGQTVSVTRAGVVSPVKPTPKATQDAFESDGSTFDNAAAEAAAVAAAEEAVMEAIEELTEAADEAVEAEKAAEEAAEYAAANPDDQEAAKRAEELLAIAEAAAEAVVVNAVQATAAETGVTVAQTLLNYAQTGTASVNIPEINTLTSTADASSSTTATSTTTTTPVITQTTPTTVTPTSTTTGGGAPASPA